ncbi:hypothetical protein D3C71_665370 [compost metagenome]
MLHFLHRLLHAFLLQQIGGQVVRMRQRHREGRGQGEVGPLQQVFGKRVADDEHGRRAGNARLQQHAVALGAIRVGQQAESGQGGLHLGHRPGRVAEQGGQLAQKDFGRQGRRFLQHGHLRAALFQRAGVGAAQHGGIEHGPFFVACVHVMTLTISSRPVQRSACTSAPPRRR